MEKEAVLTINVHDAKILISRLDMIKESVEASDFREAEEGLSLLLNWLHGKFHLLTTED